MGCCMSHQEERTTVYEVVLDRHGVAQRVPKGKGTHFIHVTKHNETKMVEKADSGSFPCPEPTFQAPMRWSQRIHPKQPEQAELNPTLHEKEAVSPH